MVVDVVCTYLRMPYTAPARIPPRPQAVTPAAAPANEWEEPPFLVRGQDPAREELQVRQAAQRILVAHLTHSAPGTTFSGTGQRYPTLRRPKALSWFGNAQTHAADRVQRRRPPSQRTFWPGIGLDLTGAVLIDFDFTGVLVSQARFGAVTFHGRASFNGATFQGSVLFTNAKFEGSASFYMATFQSDVWFNGATFESGLGFNSVTFQGDAWFTETTFQDEVEFERAVFHGSAWFLLATFQDRTEAEGVAGAQVLRLNDRDPRLHRLWPNGYSVRPDLADPTRRTLVHAEQVEKPEPAIPPSDQPADNGLGTG